MEKFGAPKPTWEGNRDIAAEAIGEESLKKADEMLGDLDLALADDTDVVKSAQDRQPEDPMALTPEKAKTADEILSGDPSQNIYYVQERPDRLGLTDVPAATPLAKASVDVPPAPVADTRYDRVGRNFTAPTPTRSTPPAPTAKPKGFFQKLFGG